MKYLIFTISLLGLISCKDQNNHNLESQEKQEKHDQHDGEVTHHHDANNSNDVYGNHWTQDIQLDDGAKWEANAATNEGVEKMQKTLNTKETNTLEEYHKLASELNVDKNYVIKNCTMKGASHDNLHVWLLPLIAKIDALSETTTLDDASKIKENLKENVESYSDYFD